jgi:hypothetical protein
VMLSKICSWSIQYLTKKADFFINHTKRKLTITLLILTIIFGVLTIIILSCLRRKLMRVPSKIFHCEEMRTRGAAKLIRALLVANGEDWGARNQIRVF